MKAIPVPRNEKFVTEAKFFHPTRAVARCDLKFRYQLENSFDIMNKS